MHRRTHEIRLTATVHEKYVGRTGTNRLIWFCNFILSQSCCWAVSFFFLSGFLLLLCILWQWYRALQQNAAVAIATRMGRAPRVSRCIWINVQCAVHSIPFRALCTLIGRCLSIWIFNRVWIVSCSTIYFLVHTLLLLNRKTVADRCVCAKHLLCAYASFWFIFSNIHFPRDKWANMYLYLKGIPQLASLFRNLLFSQFLFNLCRVTTIIPKKLPECKVTLFLPRGQPFLRRDLHLMFVLHPTYEWNYNIENNPKKVFRAMKSEPLKT